MTIELASLGDISERLEWLHDCPFDLDQAQCDPKARQWLDRFLRPVWETPEARHRRRAFIVYESRLPVVEARLLLRKVTEIQIVEDQEIGQYTFNRVEPAGSGLQLVFNERLRIVVSTDGEPNGTYDEAPLAGVRAVYRQVLLVRTGPRLQFDPEASTRWSV